MLDTFGMAKAERRTAWLVAALERIFGATIFFGTDSRSEQCSALALPERSPDLVRPRPSTSHNGSDHLENVIVLSDEFYGEIRGTPDSDRH